MTDLCMLILCVLMSFFLVFFFFLSLSLSLNSSMKRTLLGLIEKGSSTVVVIV